VLYTICSSCLEKDYLGLVELDEARKKAENVKPGPLAGEVPF